MENEMLENLRKLLPDFTVHQSVNGVVRANPSPKVYDSKGRELTIMFCGEDNGDASFYEGVVRRAYVEEIATKGYTGVEG